MADPPIVERESDPADVFGALSDPTRVAILQALWDAEDHEATFSELRAAVEVEDSGRFNYHLSKLRDKFITKENERYRFRLAGRRVVGALISGAYTQSSSAESVPIDFECPQCGSSTTFRYENEEARIVCDDQDHVSMQLPIPPGVFAGYASEDLPGVVDRYGKTVLRRSRLGFCVNCEGRVDATMYPIGEISDTHGDDPINDVPYVKYECRRCEEPVNSDIGNALVDHPAVVAFYHEHGIDIRQRPSWELLLLDRDRARIVSESPLRAEVTFESDGDALTLTIDEDLEVIDTDRN